MRLGGRLQAAYLPFEIKHPIILPQKSLLTRKIIISCHENVLHSGVNATLNETIIRGRQQIKSLCGRCLKCLKLKGMSGNEILAPLPKERLMMANPFKITGVDFAGPLYVTDNDNKKQNKAYIMLLTCAVVRALRAVHLELVRDMSAESCLKAFRKFFARRGIPNIIYSDNAKTFKRVSKEIQELSSILTSEKIQDLRTKYRIEWRFIVERAAWWGGFWERMVKTVKDAIKLTLGRACINYDEMQTILTEVEAIINSRPLTFIDDDPSNLFVLTPSHFLLGTKECGFSIDLKNPEIKRNDLLQLWKGREKIMTKFWKRWCTDYLQQLRSAHHTPNQRARSLKKGDIVLLHDQHLPRLQWKMVRVIDLFQGRDGRVRACEIQTSNGMKLRRPVQLLYPLEVEHLRPREDVKNPDLNPAHYDLSPAC